MNLIEKLKEAHKRMEEAESALAKDIWNEGLRLKFSEAELDLLDIERSVAALENRDYAIDWKIGENWRRGGHGALVFSDQFTCVLVFKENCDYVIININNYKSFKLSEINDEVIVGHPLYGRGIKAYGTYMVINSSWISELRATNSIHPQFDPEHWAAQKHYMLCFKDCIFEAITAAQIEWARISSREEVLSVALEKLRDQMR